MPVFPASIGQAADKLQLIAQPQVPTPKVPSLKVSISSEIILTWLSTGWKLLVVDAMGGTGLACAELMSGSNWKISLSSI
jgi:hypothetical protein